MHAFGTGFAAINEAVQGRDAMLQCAGRRLARSCSALLLLPQAPLTAACPRTCAPNLGGHHRRCATLQAPRS